MNKFLRELIGLQQWVVWKFEERNGRKTKVLYNPITKRRAKVNVSKTWGTYAQAQKVAHQFDGIGFVFTKDDLIFPRFHGHIVKHSFSIHTASGSDYQ